MIYAKRVLIGLCIVGTMAVSVSAAQGATLKWLILNSSKTTATELKAALFAWKDSEHLTLDGEVSGLKVAVTCAGIPNFKFNGLNLEVGGKLTEGGKVIFTGCKVYKQAPLKEEYKCTVRSFIEKVGTIESNELKGKLELVESELLAKIEPIAGIGPLAEIWFEGPECVLPEVNRVRGVVYVKDEEATKHQREHLISASPSTALYIGGHSAKQLEVTKLLGSIGVELGGAHAGLDWAVLDTP